jgi:DNA-binding NtrC family response regulator
VEEKVFTRVGGREDLRVDLRIMAATNQDLSLAVAEKRFREDLLYRLRVLEVKLPPLRERMSDLPALSAYLLAGIAGNRKLVLAEDTISMLKACTWPGNVRELRNALEHAVAVCGGSILLPTHFSEELRNAAANGGAPGPSTLDAALHEWVESRLREKLDYDALHGELESRLLAALLPRYEGKPTLLARALDMNRATLRKKLRGRQGSTEEVEEEKSESV